MTDYEITYIVDPETLTEEVIDELYGAFDCLAGGRHHGGAFVTLTVATTSARAAINSGCVILQQRGLRVLDVDRDLVDVAEIAARTNTSRQTVHNWISGRRQGGDFPTLFTEAGRGLWLWGEVQEWALEKGIHVEDADVRYPSRSDHDRASLLVRNGWETPADLEHHYKSPGPRPTRRDIDIQDAFLTVLAKGWTERSITVDTHYSLSGYVTDANRERARRRTTHA